MYIKFSPESISFLTGASIPVQCMLLCGTLVFRKRIPARLSDYLFMSSAKLQVRPILLKKISLMIFFNNCLSDSQYVAIEKKKSTEDFFFSK
jgi:hypothetical protein